MRRKKHDLYITFLTYCYEREQYRKARLQPKRNAMGHSNGGNMRGMRLCRILGKWMGIAGAASGVGSSSGNEKLN